MSSDKSTEPRYSAFDHLKKEAAQKAQPVATVSTGVPGVLKVFLVTIVIFGGLLASGLLTGPGPTNLNNDQDSPFNYDEGANNLEALTDLCVNHEGLSAHYHFNLELFVNGDPEVVPANIGIESSSCYRPIHTHDSTGYVHVELPTNYQGNNPTVGDFFSIWGQTLSPNGMLGQAGEVTMTVNSVGQSGNIQYYVPSDGDVIVLRLDSL